MILEKQTEALVQQDGESQESIAMSLDLDSAQVLMQMLSKNLYSDAVGSTIRECASNALDSHRRAGVDKPIIVSLERNNQGNYEFSVEDFGTGLDDDDVKNIISKYGKSTKRNSANELGMMGLGFKAPLAYSSSFYFTCRKNGVERKYMMYEGEDTNTIDLLYETETTESNGVKVVIPVNYHDVSEFNKKIREQLAYFENVYFNVNGIENDFVIVRHEDFQFSQLSSDKYLHICLDNVYYPLDAAKVEVDALYFPIALRFSLTDGIFPTPNRESIRYTQEAKNIIKAKLQKVANYFVDKYNESVEETDDFSLIYDYHTSMSKKVKFGETFWDVNPLSKYATSTIKAPKFKGVDLLDFRHLVFFGSDYMFGEYDAKFIVNSKTIRDAKSYYNLKSIKKILDSKVYVYESDRVSGLKKDYIKTFQKHKWDDAIILRKSRNFRLFSENQDFNCYHKLLNLKKYPKDQWRTIIKEFHLVLNAVTSKFINLDTLEVSEEFIESRKKARASVVVDGVRRTKLQGEFVCRMGTSLERYVSGKNCKWVSKIYDIATFHRNKFVLVYGRDEDVPMMDSLFKSAAYQKVKFAVMSEREFKVVEKIELHNLIPFSKFMEGKTKPFQRMATAFLIEDLYSKYNNIFRRRSCLMKISKSLYETVDRVNAYRNKNAIDCSYDARKVIIEHAKEINGFDMSIYDEVMFLKKVFEKLPFLNTMIQYAYSDESGMVQPMIDLFKYHKHRINWENYKIVLNEDLPLEDELSTEEVEELVEE